MTNGIPNGTCNDPANRKGARLCLADRRTTGAQQAPLMQTVPIVGQASVSADSHRLTPLVAHGAAARLVGRKVKPGQGARAEGAE